MNYGTIFPSIHEGNDNVSIQARKGGIAYLSRRLEIVTIGSETRELSLR
jgi:hypothetical protein